MTELTPSLSPGPEPAGVPEPGKGIVRVGDRVFSGLAVGAAVFVVVLAAFKALLSRYTGKSDIVLQNTSGATFLWEMDGLGVKAFGEGERR